MQAIEPSSMDYARDFVAYFLGMLWQALLSLPSVFGTNWIAILVTVLIFVLTLFIKMRRTSFNAVKIHWKENLKDGIVITLIVWVFVFAFNITKTIYDNHRNLINSNKSLQTKLENSQSDKQEQLKTKNLEVPRKQQAPIINVYTSPPDRRIPATRRNEIVRTLAKNPDNAYVIAPANDREAFQLAVDIWGILKDAGWSLPGGDIYNEVGQHDPGIIIESYGEKGEGVQGGGSVQDNVAIVLMNTMNQINLRARAVSGSEKDMAPGKFLRIIVGPRPPS